jgi:Short C-terminal domain
MPFMRRRPLLRAAAVGGGAYIAGKHVAQRQADQQDQQDPAQPAAEVPAQRAPSMADQLDQLAGLHDQGALSDDEFAAAKAKLLGS